MARDMIEAEVFTDPSKNPQTEQERIRRLWVTELRQQKHRQCRSTGTDGFGGVCGMELLREITGAPRTWPLSRVGELAGLDYSQTIEAICRNDGRSGCRPHTFGELAGWLEGERFR